MRACRIGPVLKLTPHEGRAGWLAPAALGYEATFNPLMLHAKHAVVSDGRKDPIEPGRDQLKPGRGDDSATQRRDHITRLLGRCLGHGVSPLAAGPS